MIVSQAEEMNPLRRCTMEDCCVAHGPDFFRGGDVHPNKKTTSDVSEGKIAAVDDTWELFGVYDGHGGRDIVDFLECSLARNIAQELRAEDDAPILERLERSFLLTDIQSYMAGLHTSGATVVTCLVKHHPNVTRKRRKANDGPLRRRATVYTANCGDARSVLYSNGRVTRLSHDHKSDDPSEIERIERSGGFVLKGRVCGILAVSRSLGDHGLKEYVIAKPHLSEIIVEFEASNGSTSDGEDAFIILACDGLWDVVSDEEAVNIVRKGVTMRVAEGASEEDASKRPRPAQHRRNESVRNPYDSTKRRVAQLLIDEAMRRGSGDNISVVVAWF